jgi:hypothetical protein
MAESAALHDWPSSATAPYLVLTAEELEALADAPFWTHQRVSAPYLTATEQAALRQHAKEMLALARKAFSEDNSQSSPGGLARLSPMSILIAGVIA